MKPANARKASDVAGGERHQYSTYDFIWNYSEVAEGVLSSVFWWELGYRILHLHRWPVFR